MKSLRKSWLLSMKGRRKQGKGERTWELPKVANSGWENPGDLGVVPGEGRIGEARKFSWDVIP